MAQILLVDDEKVARALYSDFLTGAGHSVTAVGSANEARTELSKQRYDVVVTDLILPGTDGMQLLLEIKFGWPETEVLVITALDKVDPAVRAIKSGASDYLVKPVNPEVLAHAVTRALTTRTVLKENEALRHHVALAETAQRLATTLDKEHLFPQACAAFTQASNAAAALLLMRNDEGYKVQGHYGLSDEELEAIAPRLEDNLSDGLDARGQELTLALPDPFETGYLVPAVHADHPYGAVALLFKGATPEQGLSAAAYLSPHLGLALRNLGRFSEVEDLVYLDDLTHLFNSRYLDVILEKDLKTAKPPPEGKAFSLLFMDLDYFKSVNDAHGHVVGSKLLVEVAGILKRCVRDGDIVTRWGGDEYVILLRGTDSGGALKVGERIRRSIEQHKFLAREGYALSVTTCIGLASWPEHAPDKATLLDLADRAMYRGKKGSRNIIYMAAKNLEATPIARHQTQPPDVTAT